MNGRVSKVLRRLSVLTGRPVKVYKREWRNLSCIDRGRLSRAIRTRVEG